MSQGGFYRGNPIGPGFIRNAARLLVEPYTSPYPSNITSIINLATSGYTTEVQTLTMTGGPTGGTFALAFNFVPTAAIAYNASAAAVQTALQEISTIGPGNVTCSGGPLPATPIVITFAGSMASLAQPLITVPPTLNLLTGGTTPAASVARTTAGLGLYDPIGSWTELGMTKTGAHIDHNNTETLIDVDQILTTLTAIPDNWEMTVTTALAETTLENVQVAWEGGPITTDITQTPNERHIGVGAPIAYNFRRLAVVTQKTVGPYAGFFRAHVFRLVSRSPQASRLSFDKTGPQQTLPIVFRCFADTTVGDPNLRMGEILDQAPY